MSSNRSLLSIAAGIVALLALTVAVVLLAGDRKAHEFAPDSPEAALEGYLAAWDTRDFEAAYSYFSQRVRSTTSLEQYQLAADDFARYQMPPDGPVRRVFIDRVIGSGDRVTVQLIVEERYGDGLSNNVQRSMRSVRMVSDTVSHVVNRWRIDEPLVYLDPSPVYEPMK